MTKPTQNQDAERTVLGCMLLSDEAIAECTDLRPDDFAVPAYRATFEAIRELTDQRKPADPITVGDVMATKGQGGHLRLMGESLLGIADGVSSWRNVGHFVEIVARDGATRRLISLAAELGERALGGTDLRELLNHARAGLAELETGKSGGPVRMGDGVMGALDMIGERSKDPDGYAVGTGIREFDQKIGGFRAQNLVVVAARPGIGKTAFAGTIARRAAVARGIPTLVFSLEMSFQELTERFIGAEARFPVERLTRGNISRPEFSALMLKLADLRNAPLWIDQRVLTIAQIETTARRWRAQQKTRQALIVIDYLGLVKPSDRRAENRTLEVGRMAWAAKMMAKDLDCPVMLVSQLNRASADGDAEPELHNLRDSGEIEQHADTVIFPHRSKPLDQSGPAWLIVAKNRGGKMGKVRCHWHAELMTFENPADGYAEESHG